MREEPFLQPGDEHRLEFQALGRVDGHQLHGIHALLGLAIAGFQRGMSQEGRQRRDLHHGRCIGRQHGAICCRLRRARQARAGRRGGIDAAFGLEGQRRIDQFLQVLDALLPLAFLLVVGHETASADHVVDALRQRQAGAVLAHELDEHDELQQPRAARAARHRHGTVEADAVGARRVLQVFERAGADAARREVHHPQEGAVVVRILDQPQVGQGMLDLGPLEEAQPAVDLVGHPGRKQRVFQDA